MLSRSDFSVTSDISQHLLGEYDFNPLKQWFSNFFWYALLQMLEKGSHAALFINQQRIQVEF